MTALVAGACGRDVGPLRHVDAPIERQIASVRTTEAGRQVQRPVAGETVEPETAAPESPAPTAETPDAAERDDARPLIGLVASNDEDVTAALAAGARRALAESRAAGGPDLRLRVSPHESRWGAAAEAAVRLAMDDGALAIIAPPERTRAHPVAQFGTKAGVPIVSTSPAPSVMQAGSKWVTSVVPPREGPLADPPSGDWEQAGYDAARSVLAAVEKNGLRRLPYGN